ncbi:MAG TPA: CorA family divalent cation transporter [Steroidobacteraceae bacterium]|nr:CorA family divalent cation transporter [Steroidobacteraceae bacterium]
MTDAPTMVRHFRQIVLWPVQLMPLKAGVQVQRHWEALGECGGTNPWRNVRDELYGDPQVFQERHYKEFVTFLPYVQRFLYGSTVGQEASQRHGEPSIHVFRRTDIAKTRVTYDDGERIDFSVTHADLYFFLDADIAILQFELHADNLTLDRVQDTLFRFGRAYPAFWDAQLRGGNCPRGVEWLDANGNVLAASDYDARSKYLEHVKKYRSPAIASHWEYLLKPLILEYPGQVGPLRYRQLEYYRMPIMAYLAVDDPTRMSRGDFARLGLGTRPGEREASPYSNRYLESFEADYCDDRFWGRAGAAFSGDTRLICTGQILAVVGSADDYFFAGRETGMMGQFRHQYFLLFLIAHFHKAALVSMSDELAVAMNRLEIDDLNSVRQFKRAIRFAMEIFLRFTHRYWFHEVSNQAIARDIFRRLTRQLGTDEIYQEVRAEVEDMNEYLDTDSVRRQANTILRLTVVTIFGLIGTVATGFLGMNLIADADRPLSWRIVFFLAVLGLTTAVTFYTIVKSRRLADFLDALSDERVGWKQKLKTLGRTWKD